MKKLILLLVLSVVYLGCQNTEKNTETSQSESVTTPQWAQEAVWYQIMVERFRNGDSHNDPTVEDIQGTWPHKKPAGWAPTDWGHAWNSPTAWEKNQGEIFGAGRRYGGDIQGILDRLDYIESLGITALYLNPINDSPSMHKYDARNYRHVDYTLGPDPAGDKLIMAQEDPGNPETWQITSADSLFLVLVKELHQRNMKVILDYSWNHTGTQFWAWQDILQHQEESKYADWYDINQFDDPATDENEFSYDGWIGVQDLPEFKKVGRPAGVTRGAFAGNLHPEVKAHVFAVTKRWMDPNNDGDFSDGVDGFRLDVAEMVPLDFWKEYEIFVHGLNSEAYLVAETWWEKWPDHMMDPAPWLDEKVFDAVMNYRWYKPARSFIAANGLASDFAAEFDSVQFSFDENQQKAMMSMSGSHDSPRLITSLLNGEKKYKFNAKPREDATYDWGPGNDLAAKHRAMILTFQFMQRGAPSIWNGDEVGMWGADDPDNRKPVLWDDITYTPEIHDPNGNGIADPQQVAPNMELWSWYRSLIQARKQHQTLIIDGTSTFDLVDDERKLVIQRRQLGENVMLVVMSAGGESQEVDLSKYNEMQVVFGDGALAGKILTIDGNTAVVLIPANADL